MEAIKVGDFVAYKGMPDSPVYRVCEVDGWGQAVIMDITGRSKYARTVQTRQMEVV
jgi:hypothetical protein